MRAAGLYDDLPAGVLKKNWVVNIKPVDNGQAILKYLAPYIYRVAISDSRIEQVDEEGVAYRVKPSGKNDWVKRRANGQQFVASFVQHILPSGFQKVRYYGWMSPNCKLQLEGIRWLIWLYLGWTYWLGSGVAQPKTSTVPVAAYCDWPDHKCVLGHDQFRERWRHDPRQAGDCFDLRRSIGWMHGRCLSPKRLPLDLFTPPELGQRGSRCSRCGSPASSRSASLDPLRPPLQAPL